MTGFEYFYKGVKILVEKGDITKLEVDAIVNAANSMLIMGGGVAGAVLRTGGREIQEEALKHAPVPVGKAVATKAGRLKAKYVVHALTPEEAAQGMVQEIKGHIDKGTNLKQIILVGFTEDLTQAFQNTLRTSMLRFF